jgi:hypothetical protein
MRQTDERLRHSMRKLKQRLVPNLLFQYREPQASRHSQACRWVNMKLSCSAGISIGDFRAMTVRRPTTGLRQIASDAIQKI